MEIMNIREGSKSTNLREYPLDENNLRNTNKGDEDSAINVWPQGIAGRMRKDPQSSVGRREMIETAIPMQIVSECTLAWGIEDNW